MKSGRSFSEPSSWRWIGRLGVLCLAFCLRPAPAPVSLAAVSSSDPARVASSAPASERLKACPRCGYRCDASWRYCVRCGWELRLLVGREAEERLDALTRAIVGVTVIHKSPTLQQILSPKDYETIRRYITWNPGLHKSFGTAIPILQPGLFVTAADTLTWVDKIEVRTHNNTVYPGEVIGYDLASGVGVFRAIIPSVEPIVPSEDSQQTEGAWIVCYPVTRDDEIVRYLPVSLHRGRMTGAGESGTYLASFENLLRSDHTISDGCPGGGLIDQRGSLAGMVLGSPDTGITYEIPIQQVAPIARAFVRGEKPTWAYFGIGLVTADNRRRARFGIDVTPEHPLVGFLVPHSPASEAGLRPGDILVAVDDENVVTAAAAGLRLLAYKPAGPPVMLSVRRGGQDVRVQVKPAARPSRIVLEPIDELQEGLEANLIEVTTGSSSQMGLRVADLVRGGRGEVDHYKDGDIIISVNGKGVRKIETLNEIIRSQNPHIFTPAEEEGDVFSTYAISLEVRAKGEEKKEREYFSRFPDSLSPPVY